MKKLLLSIASLIFMLANSASATIILVQPSQVPDGSGGFHWTYAATLQPGQDMAPGDFFTIFDFPFADAVGFPQFGTTGADKDASFEVTVQDTGLTPPNTGFPDLPITNVTVKLLDGDSTTGSADSLSAASGPLQLGTLIIRSTTDAIAQSNYGTVLQLGTLDEISSGGPIDVALIPEPGSITLLIVGLVAVGALSYRRRRAPD